MQDTVGPCWWMLDEHWQSPQSNGCCEPVAGQVRIVASLPCYTGENVDDQRGSGVFRRSILALQLLNAAGYGQPGSHLQLDLVYNPTGTFLAPPQAQLQVHSWPLPGLSLRCGGGLMIRPGFQTAGAKTWHVRCQVHGDGMYSPNGTFLAPSQAQLQIWVWVTQGQASALCHGRIRP